MRLVLDTDVVLSGLRSHGGASRLLLCAVTEGIVIPVVTVATILELEDVLMRPEHLAATGLTPGETTAVLDNYLRHADRVAVHARIRPNIRDPSDEIFVEAFVYGRADAIVTFNRRDYLAADVKRASRGEAAVPVVNPGEVLRRLRWRPTTTIPFVFPHR